MGGGYIDPHFLDLGTSWRRVVSFMPLPLYPRERDPGTHFIGGWVDPRAGLDDMEKWKFLPYRDSNSPLPGRPARSQSLYRLSYPGSQGLYLVKYCFLEKTGRLIGETVFYSVCAKQQYHNVSRQHLGKHICAYRTVLCKAVTSSTIELFSMRSVPRLYNESREL
jgi:hypothetical protein